MGVIGVGDISSVYLNALSRSSAVRLHKIASRHLERLGQIAANFAAEATSAEALLADDAIELVVNLTPGNVHEAVNAAAIEAGKHVYSEKPFALSRRVAEELAERAHIKGVLIGSAPDTFYGGAHQAARRAVDSGALGNVVFGSSFVGLPGLELFHPNPAAFYQPGGEPPFDLGPYYYAMWIHLLGPVRQVYASSGRGKAEPLFGTGHWQVSPSPSPSIRPSTASWSSKMPRCRL